jgi:hypothetical protein
LNLPQTHGSPTLTPTPTPTLLLLQLPGIVAGLATSAAGFVLEKALTKAFIEYMSIFKF